MSITLPAANLSHETEITQRLIHILKQEQAYLIENNIVKLTTITEEKTQTVLQLSELATARHQAVAAAGFPATEEGMQKWLKSAAATAAAYRSWTDLLNLAREAKELNRVNGLLINKHMMQTHHALNTLRGGLQVENFYGPDGQSTSSHGSRRLSIG